MNILHTDVLIIGSGLSSWMAARTLLEKKDCQVLMVADGAGASPWVHGFNVPLLKEDSVDCFYKDTRASGYYQNDPALAAALCKDSVEIFKQVQTLGEEFNRTATGEYQLLRPLGASYPRVASIGNETGPAIMAKLKKWVKAHPNFKKISYVRALELMTDQGQVCGALCFNTKAEGFFAISAQAVLLANGGFGRIYPFSTNKPDGGGDGVAMAYKAGADLVDMEFVQFEPSAAVHPPKLRGQSVITTLFYEGAVLKNAQGERFMLQNSPKGEQVDKDVLARCMAKEIKEGRGSEHGGVWFDATGVNKGVLEKNYPVYVKRYRNVGIELSESPIELAPAPHTTLGGVVINDGCTTTAKSLIAAGEVVGGIHGANRIGGNAGLETLVFGKRAGETLATVAFNKRIKDEDILSWAKEKASIGQEDIAQDLAAIKKGLDEALDKGANVLRHGKQISKSLEIVETLEKKIKNLSGAKVQQAFYRLRLENDVLAGKLLLLAAEERRESVGCHIREDFPKREENLYRVHITKGNNGPRVWREDWTKQGEIK